MATLRAATITHRTGATHAPGEPDVYVTSETAAQALPDRASARAATAAPADDRLTEVGGVAVVAHLGRRRFAWRVAGLFSARPRLHSLVSSRCAVLLATPSRRAMSDRRLPG